MVYLVNCQEFVALLTCLLSFIVTVLTSHNFHTEFISQNSSNVFVEELLIPNVKPTKHDEYVCTSKELEKDRESFIVQIEAQAEAKKAHHILLFGCSAVLFPYRNKKYWRCGEGNVCIGMKILFAWAKNAAPTHLPKDVGFKIGGSSGISHLVLQVHYAVPLNVEDNSGLRLHVTYQPQKYLAGILLLVALTTVIPPHMESVPADVNCMFDSNSPMHAFAYRVHAHNLGVVVSGYKMGRDDGRWTLLGKGNPQWPQAFYPMSETVTVQHGDILASRCIFNSTSRNTVTSMGSTANDEMCNFYIMYYMSSHGRISQLDCLDVQYPNLVSTIPVSANIPLPPNPLLEEHAIGWMHGSHGTADSTGHQHAEHLPVIAGNMNDANPNVYKKVHGVPSVDYTDDYDSLGKHHRPSYGNDEEGSSLVYEPGLTDAYNPDMANPDVINRGHVHHAVDSGQHTASAAVNSSIQGQSAVQPQGKFLSWFMPATTQQESLYTDVANWPSFPSTLGQVTSLAFDTDGNIVIFHRGPHIWGFTTFDLRNRYRGDKNEPIDEDTVLTFHKDTGVLTRSWGRNLFYMPHGLFLDSFDNMWITDVALHQVFKFSSNGSVTPLLTLGVRFEPDDDNTHFCKPSSVAVMQSGEFFVADGYCNNRILKYSAKGELLLQWGRRTTSLLGYKLGVPPAYAFDIPHSLALAEDKGLLLVADRENGRIQCFYTKNGMFHSQIQDDEFGGRLFGVSYSPLNGGTVFAVNGPSIGLRKRGVKGFVINLDSRQTIGYFTPNERAMSNPHDIISTPDGQFVYVAEIGPNRVWKYVLSESSKERKIFDGGVVNMKLNKTNVPTSPEVVVTPMPVKLSSEPSKTVETHLVTAGNHHQNGRAVNTNFTASMIIMSLLAIPILIVVFITVFVRLKKQGKFYAFNISHVKGWMTGYKNPNNNRFAIGNLLNRHKGFDRVNVEDSDIDPEGSDSDVEEFNVSTAQKA